jgi:hypothetical protein
MLPARIADQQKIEAVKEVFGLGVTFMHFYAFWIFRIDLINRHSKDSVHFNQPVWIREHYLCIIVLYKPFGK